MTRCKFVCLHFVLLLLSGRSKSYETLRRSLDHKLTVRSGGCEVQSEFRCNNGHCLDQHYVCNGNNDCQDNSDEAVCGGSKPDFINVPSHHQGHCQTEYEYACANGNCIHQHYLCDGDNDCKDNSDENMCNHHYNPIITTQAPTCNAQYEFTCSNRKCVNHRYMCNGVNDCGDNSDENFCPQTTTTRRTTVPLLPLCDSHTEYTCANLQCVNRLYMCNGYDDCGDNTDEAFCPHTTTAPTIPSSPIPICNPRREYTCANRKCINPYYLCNGYDDCGDNSDEAFCSQQTTTTSRIQTTTPTTPTSCLGTDYTCANRKCINSHYFCNGYDDCGDNSDENFCSLFQHQTTRQQTTTTPRIQTTTATTPTSCRPTDFKCANRKCINRHYFCNGYDDCGDNTDEKFCSLSQHQTTHTTQGTTWRTVPFGKR